jgi:CDP-paratose 2-epimerase
MKNGSERPVVITGGAGFIGSNLADRLAGEGNAVVVYDALSRPGVERNLAWLKGRHGQRVQSVIADVRDAALVAEVVRDARAVFHMAAQVAVTTSLSDPRLDHEINVGGTFNVLEAVRRAKIPPAVIFASTNKVYGNLADLEFTSTDQGYLPSNASVRAYGIGEQRPLDFHTPYGCSKGAADQYVLDYARSFGLPAAVLRMSCIYGERQMGTEDQGWVAHFVIRALEGRDITLYGDGHQVRDILQVSNAVDAYIAAWRRIDGVAGRAFNLGGGPGNAVSLRTLISYIGELLGTEPGVRFDGWRAGDQRYFVADTRSAQLQLGLAAPMPWRAGVAKLARWLAVERGRGKEPAGSPAVEPARAAAL